MQVPESSLSQVAFPAQVVPHTAAHTGMSAGAKLGFAAAALIFAVAIWFAVHPSTNHSASMNPTTVSISPAVVRVVPGGTVRVMASVNGDDRDVQWTIAEGSSGGSIEAGALLFRMEQCSCWATITLHTRRESTT